MDQAIELDLNSYQKQATATAIYPGQGGLIGLTYAALGLNGEAGETGEQVKKIWRDDVVNIEAEVLKALDEIKDGLAHSMAYALIMERAEQRVHEIFSASISAERRRKLESELGDTLWYAAQVATELGLDLGQVAQQNLDKLAERKASEKIQGEGSDR